MDKWELVVVTADNPIARADLQPRAEQTYGDMVKAVVDLKRQVMVLGTEMHADAEQYLLEDGSQQADLWGINIYPQESDITESIEFDSMINIRPGQNNRSRYVEDPAIRNHILEVVSKLISD